MATCKDCLHVEVCSKKYLHITNGTDFIYRCKYNRVEQECKHFKDRSRFVELPLKVGDTFYTFNYDEDAISKQTVEEIRIIDDIDGDNIVFYGQCVVFTLKEIGTFAFLTRVEAEAELKQRTIS